MSSRPGPAARRGRRRTALGAALAAPTALLLALPAGLLPSAHAAPAPTPGTADCGLQVLARSDTGSDSELLVALPERLAGVDVPAEAFSVQQADRTVPLTLRRTPGTEQVVAIVLASSSGTTPAQFDVARAAALELLAGLPAGVRTAVGSTGSTVPLAPLSQDRAGARRSVQLAQPGAGDGAAAAVDRLARDLPTGAHVVLLSDEGRDDRGRPVHALASRLEERGTVLTRVAYAGPSSPQVASAWSTSPSQRACAAATARAPLARQLDLVQAQLRSQYLVSAALRATGPAVLSVRAAGTTSSIQLAGVEAAPAVADPYRRTGPSGTLTVLLLALAAELAVLGLLLGIRPRRHRPADATAPSQHRVLAGPPAPDEDDLRRVGPGSRSRSRG